MKTATKVFLILAAAFLLLGIVLCLVSAAIGGNPWQYVVDGVYSITIVSNDSGRDGDFGQHSVNISEERNNYSVSGELKNIEIDWVSGNVKIVRGEGKSRC